MPRERHFLFVVQLLLLSGELPAITTPVATMVSAVIASIPATVVAWACRIIMWPVITTTPVTATAIITTNYNRGNNDRNGWNKPYTYPRAIKPAMPVASPGGSARICADTSYDD